jgi:hypothetical protein
MLAGVFKLAEDIAKSFTDTSPNIFVFLPSYAVIFGISSNP